jgi:hypothetical protein
MSGDRVSRKATAENVCVWDAFGDFSCKRPSAELNAFTTGGEGLEFFANGDFGKKKPPLTPLAPLAALAPAAAGAAARKEGFCGCSAEVPQ